MFEIVGLEWNWIWRRVWIKVCCFSGFVEELVQCLGLHLMSFYSLLLLLHILTVISLSCFFFMKQWYIDIDNNLRKWQLNAITCVGVMSVTLAHVGHGIRLWLEVLVLQSFFVHMYVFSDDTDTEHDTGTDTATNNFIKSHNSV